jgi:hypothetical protein
MHASDGCVVAGSPFCPRNGPGLFPKQAVQSGGEIRLGGKVPKHFVPDHARVVGLYQ